MATEFDDRPSVPPTALLSGLAELTLETGWDFFHRGEGARDGVEALG